MFISLRTTITTAFPIVISVKALKSTIPARVLRSFTINSVLLPTKETLLQASTTPIKATCVAHTKPILSGALNFLRTRH